MSKRMLVLYIVLVLALSGAAFSAAAGAPDAAPAGGSSLGNYVWLDLNGDGDHIGQVGESEFTGGINGVLVNLYLDSNANGVIDSGEFLTSTTTGDSPDPGTQTGYYLFGGITADGNRYIVQIDPSNFASGGPLDGYLFTSGDLYGPSPLVVSLPDPIMTYLDADFGFMPVPLTIDKALVTSQYAQVGASVVFGITVTNNGTFTIDPAPLDDFYSPACLHYVSATVEPTAVDTALGHLYWQNIGPIAGGAFKYIEVTFQAQNTQDMAYKEGGWEDYAPKGIPDFDERQTAWDTPVGSAAGWYQCGPVAAANSLWWFDSKFEPDGAKPPTIRDNYPLVPSFSATNAWDDHDPRNVQPLVNKLSELMGTTAAVGTTPTGLAYGVSQYIADRGLATSYTVTTMPTPAFAWVGSEVRSSEDVVLLVGFWQVSETGGPAVRIGGHYVTTSGIDLAQNQISLNDPMRDQAELTGAGRVLPGAHSDLHPGSPLGAAGDAIHNDAQYVSQDAYAIAELQLAAGQWGLVGYVDPNLTAACTQLAVFQDKNVPGEFATQQGACSPNGGQIYAVVEYAVAVSPLLNTLICAPTTNIAAVSNATVPDTGLVLPPVQDEDRVSEGMDFGDLADSPYPTLLASLGARHLIVSPLRLGTLIDSELDGQPSAATNGDDTGNLADEDGVITLPSKLWKDGAVALGNGGALQITVSGGNGVPQVFMDFNGSGLQALTLRDSAGNLLPTAPWTPGTYDVYFDIPDGTMAPGPTIYLRVRLSSAGGLGATGPAPDGEVEDYQFPFSPNAVSVQALSATQSGNLGAMLALLVLLAAAVTSWRVLALRTCRHS